MAASEIEKLEARYAENPDGRYFAPLADAYRKAGRVDDALQLVTQGLTKHPEYLSAHIVRGRCYLDKKDDPSALEAFQRVLDLDTENIIALKSLSEIAERQGNPDDARRWLTRLLVVDAMNTEAEEDLKRLGGPLAEAEQSAAPEAAPALEISFADEPVVTAAPQAPADAAQVPTEPVPALTMTEDAGPALELTPEPSFTPSAEPAEGVERGPEGTLSGLEPAAFAPPAEAPPAAPIGTDIMPFDDALEWGAGERQSRAVHAEDIVEAEKHHEATSAAIEFTGAVDDGQSHVAPSHIDTEGPTLELARLSMSAPPPADLPPAPAAAAAPPEVPSRPTPQELAAVSPEPVVASAEAPRTEPMLTETMGDLYLKQGFKAEAADVYRRLLAQRPDDPALRAKLAEIESPPAMSASALGTEAVGSWLKRIARSVLGTPAPRAAPPAPEGQSPMEAAFQTGEHEAVATEAAPEAPPPGEPAHQAAQQFSLDQIFGAAPPPTPEPAPEPAPAAATAPALGASFDEFFGNTGAVESARPREGDQTPRQSEDDLGAFTAWLHGLKK